MMTQEQAQELAVKTWGENAIAKIVDYVEAFGEKRHIRYMYVASTRFGLPIVNGMGDTFEVAFFESQFHWWNEAGKRNVNHDGTRTNHMHWPESWDKHAA